MIIDKFLDYVNDRFCETLDEDVLNQIKFYNNQRCFNIYLFGVNKQIKKYLLDNGNELLHDFFSIDDNNLERDYLISYLFYSNYTSILAKKDGYNYISDFNDYNMDEFIIFKNYRLYYLVNYSSNDIIEKMRDSIMYYSDNSVVLLKILVGFNKYMNEIIYYDRYNSAFKDFCNGEYSGYYIKQFLFDNCRYINTDNLIDLVSNIYTFGNDIKCYDEVLKKSDCFYKTINDKIDNGSLLIDENRDDISFGKVLDVLKNYNDYSNIDDFADKYINKEKVFELRKYFDIKM